MRHKIKAMWRVLVHSEYIVITERDKDKNYYQLTSNLPGEDVDALLHTEWENE